MTLLDFIYNALLPSKLKRSEQLKIKATERLCATITEAGRGAMNDFTKALNDNTRDNT